MEKMRDLCLIQREEIKNLKDAVMNAQQQILVENQVSDLQNQVRSLIIGSISRINLVIKAGISSFQGIHLICTNIRILFQASEWGSAESCVDEQTPPKTLAYNHEALDSLV